GGCVAPARRGVRAPPASAAAGVGGAGAGRRDPRRAAVYRDPGRPGGAGRRRLRRRGPAPRLAVGVRGRGGRPGGRAGVAVPPAHAAPGPPRTGLPITPETPE